MSCHNNNNNNTNNKKNSTNNDSLCHTNFFYLTPKAVAALPKYQYNGSDNSITYKYVLSPLASYLVENFTPLTIAPNTITLLGLSFMLTAYTLIWYNCPTLDECAVDDHKFSQAPSWIFGFNGAAMLIYQTLDNMDGKQARRTGSSSPLGLLFDHGIDAINAIFGSVNWICAMGLSLSENHRSLIYIAVFSPFLTFFVATWEHYYTEVMILPVINAVSEGLLLGSSVSLATWWYGQEIWNGTEMYDTLIASWLPLTKWGYFPEEVKNYTMTVAFMAIGTSRESIFRIAAVLKEHGARCLVELIPLFLLSTLSVPIVFSGLFSRNSRSCLHLFAILFVDMVSSLMLDHMTSLKNKPYRFLLIPLIVLSSWVYSSTGTEHQIIMEQYLITYTVGAFVYLAMRFRLIIHEICVVLRIWCFDIVTPYKDNEYKTKKEA